MRATLRGIAVRLLVLAGLVLTAWSSPSAPAVFAAPAARAADATACPPALKAVFARSAGVGDVTVHQSPAADLATCRYRARHVPSGRCGAATIQVDTAPQVFRDFQRWVVETGQTAAQSSIRNPGLSPLQINGVGLEADWVPADRLFETATEKRWVTVTLNCRVSAARGLPLARHLAVAALAA